MKAAPIALFVYNRPVHTKRTLDSLSQCSMIGESKLYVFSDGPRKNATSKDIAVIDEVREMVRQIDFASSADFVFHPTNLGLSNSIVGGVSHVLNNHESVIVLEDDLIVGAEFLTFMNLALEKYACQPEIMHVSGYMPNLNGVFPEVALISLTHSWGWATWKRAWKDYNPDASYLLGEIKKRKLTYLFNYNGSFNFSRLLRRTRDGKRNSWAVRWYASIFLAGGLALNSVSSLVQNIGHDSSGTHSYNTKSFDSKITNSCPSLTVNNIEEHKGVRKALRNFFLRKKLIDGPSYYWQILKNFLVIR